MAPTIRPVSSLDELAVAVAVINLQVAELVSPDDRRFRDVPSNYPLYRDLMLLAEADGQIVGAVIGIGPPNGPGGDFSVLVKGLGVSETHRGAGVGRQLLSQLEENAAAIGAVEVHLGTVSATRGFYARLGYTGRSRMHKPLSGMGIARYGAAEERRQRLQSMRERRTNRLTHQGEPVRPGLVGAHRTGADAVTMSDPRPWPGRLDGACLPLGSAFDRRVPGHAATPAPPRRTQALGATRGDRYQRQDTSRILTLLRAAASSGSGGSWRSRAAWG